MEKVAESLISEGKKLFREGRYVEFDELLEVLGFGAARTISSKMRAFNLEALICNYLYGCHANLNGDIEWRAEFPCLIQSVSTAFSADASQDKSLNGFIRYCSVMKIPTDQMISDVVMTIKAFVTRHPEFEKPSHDE